MPAKKRHLFVSVTDSQEGELNDIGKYLNDWKDNGQITDWGWEMPGNARRRKPALSLDPLRLVIVHWEGDADLCSLALKQVIASASDATMTPAENIEIPMVEIDSVIEKKIVEAHGEKYDGSAPPYEWVFQYIEENWEAEVCACCGSARNTVVPCPKCGEKCCQDCLDGPHTCA